MKHNEKWLLLCCQVMIAKLPQTKLPKDRNQTREKNTKQKHTVNYLLRANPHSGNWLFQALESILGFLKLNSSSFEQPLENQPNVKYNSNYEMNLILKISFSKQQNNSHLKIFGFFQESLISKGKEKCVISCSKGNYLQKWIDKNIKRKSNKTRKTFVLIFWQSTVQHLLFWSSKLQTLQKSFYHKMNCLCPYVIWPASK